MPDKQLSSFEIARMVNQINRLEKRSRVDMMISEEKAAELLGVTVKTLQNKVAAKEMDGMFTVGVGGKRFYDKARLMGVTD